MPSIAEAAARLSTGPGLEVSIVVFAAALLGFLELYFGSALFALFLTRWLLPRLGIGAIVDTRPLRDGQIEREIRRSLVSILIFGGYGLLTFHAWRSGIVTVELESSLYRVARDLALL